MAEKNKGKYTELVTIADQHHYQSRFSCGHKMEKLLFKELSEFARENRKELESVEQWLNGNDFNGSLEDAWIRAGQPFDWRKIVFIAWLASDEKIYECKLKIDGLNLRQWCECDKNKSGLTPQKDFLYDVIFRTGDSYTTPKHPSFYLIRSALDEGKKAVADEKLKKNKTPDDSMQGQGNKRQVSPGELSNPMTKSAMMSRVGIDGYKKFNTFAKQHGLQQAGNRQLWQIRLDRMDKNTKQKFEKT